MAARSSDQTFSATSPVAAAHTLLDANALAKVAALHWPIESPCRGELLLHGQNDWYRIESAHGIHALRVVKAKARGVTELGAELSWTAELAATGLPVAAALHTQGGALGLAIPAPEGERFACLYPWIEGRTLDRHINSREAFAAGELLADIHRSSARLAVGVRRHCLAEKLARTGPWLDGALLDASERAAVQAARDAIAPVLQLIEQLPAGSLHGDLHFGNLRRDVNGALHALDFDDCGEGALLVDLTPFLWRDRSEGLPRELDDAFIAGYESRRPMTADERRALPAMLVARALYLAGVLARDRNKLGAVPGFERPWRHYVQLIATLSQGL